MAHIGVIQCLIDNNINIDFIVGSSIGSLVGGLYAVNGDLKLIKQFLDKIDFSTTSIKYLYIFHFRRLMSRLEKLLSQYDIENSKIKFAAVATDFFSGEIIEYNRGPLYPAVKASVGIPLIFPTFKYQNRYVVDGGLSSSVPVDCARKNSDIVIAVNIYCNLFPSKETKPTLATLGYNSLYLLLYHLSKENCRNADFVINPPDFLSAINSPDFVSKSIDAGYHECQKIIPKLQQLIADKT